MRNIEEVAYTTKTSSGCVHCDIISTRICGVIKMSGTSFSVISIIVRIATSLIVGRILSQKLKRSHPQMFIRLNIRTASISLLPLFIPVYTFLCMFHIMFVVTVTVTFSLLPVQLFTLSLRHAINSIKPTTLSLHLFSCLHHQSTRSQTSPPIQHHTTSPQRPLSPH